MTSLSKTLSPKAPSPPQNAPWRRTPAGRSFFSDPGVSLFVPAAPWKKGCLPMGEAAFLLFWRRRPSGAGGAAPGLRRPLQALLLPLAWDGVRKSHSFGDVVGDLLNRNIERRSHLAEQQLLGALIKRVSICPNFFFCCRALCFFSYSDMDSVSSSRQSCVDKMVS